MAENKNNLKFLIPAVGGAVLVVGGFAAYNLLLRGPSGDVSGAIGSAKVIPDDAIAAAYITTDPQAWAKFQEFGTPEAQKLLAKSLDEMNKSIAKEGTISYDKDIKPWIGGVMVGFLPPGNVKSVQNPPKATSEPNPLVVLGIKDKLAALEFSKKLKSQKDVQAKETDYKGEKITEFAASGKPMYMAVLSNNTYIALSQDKRAVEQSIDTVKGEPSFASKKGATELLSKGTELKNTLAQVYLPDYAGLVENTIKGNPQASTLPPQALEQIKAVKSMVAGVGIDDAGIRMKAVANTDPSLIKYQYENSQSKVVNQFPAETFAFVSGQGISKAWTAFTEQAKNYPELNQGIQQARTQLQQQAKLDLDKEVFGWMDGEFALGAIPSNQGLLASTGFGGALVFHTSDRKTAESTLGKLDSLLKAQNIQVAKRKVGDKDITEWQVPQQGAIAGHGWLDKDTLFVALGGPITDTIVANKGKTLDSSDSFKSITGSLQKPNGGYFYLDMDQTMTIANRLGGVSKSMPPETAAVINSIRGIGMTANSSDKSTSQMEVLLSLKPKSAK
ncbi:DUF3352 domain-containing protein [Calothrix sp. PCC 6303]|uniref:DUF3352 domain-containing protein n=1 Tax=Calothrix sp. PCC 6303 TaxID=1170562 RepID=UPI0002A055D7|nr:DUF3352 domain-containing protein [Calothrix sp. PCC 6303]AFZ02399.1 hypothetical protein Cal6303_3466 [Calothrix sp. PCC 6303]